MALVTLVVLGHAWTLLPMSGVNEVLYDALYAWHVPAFVFVTGYLSRSFSYTPTRMWQLVRTVLVPVPDLRVRARPVPRLRRRRDPPAALREPALADVVPRGPVLLAAPDARLPPAPGGRRRRRRGRRPAWSRDCGRATPSTSRASSACCRSSCSVCTPRLTGWPASSTPVVAGSPSSCSSRSASSRSGPTGWPAPSGSTTARSTATSTSATGGPSSPGPAVIVVGARRGLGVPDAGARGSAAGSPGWAPTRWSSTCCTASSCWAPSSPASSPGPRRTACSASPSSPSPRSVSRCCSPGVRSPSKLEHLVDPFGLAERELRKAVDVTVAQEDLELGQHFDPDTPAVTQGPIAFPPWQGRRRPRGERRPLRPAGRRRRPGAARCRLRRRRRAPPPAARAPRPPAWSSTTPRSRRSTSRAPPPSASCR